MPQTPITSTKEAIAHLRAIRVLQHPEVSTLRFPHGWVVRPTPAGGSQIVGTGAWVVDQETGTVTVHSSLPLPLIAADYSDARREGRTSGQQIWPWTAGHVETQVRALRAEPRRAFRVIELRDQVWTLTPEAIPDATPEETTQPPVTYVADGETQTIWEYPTASAVGTTYLVERRAGTPTGRQIYPQPT